MINPSDRHAIRKDSRPLCFVRALGLSTQDKIVEDEYLDISEALELKIIGHEDIGLFTHCCSKLNAVRSFENIEPRFNLCCLFGDGLLKRK